MNPIKKRLAKSLTEVAKKGMEAMDPDNACARSLQDLERGADAVVAAAIQRICDKISILEAAKLVRLSAMLTNGSGNG